MPTLYVQRTDGGLSSYDGMSQATVKAMLDAQGLTYSFIDKATYDAAVAVLRA